MTNQAVETSGTKYRRAILKLSGESFTHGGERGICMEEVVHIAREIQQAHAAGV